MHQVYTIKIYGYALIPKVSYGVLSVMSNHKWYASVKSKSIFYLILKNISIEKSKWFRDTYIIAIITYADLCELLGPFCASNQAIKTHNLTY